MIRDASLFLAIRYLKPKRTFLSVISFLSVIGPVLGVAVLIIVLSVMAGFNRDIREKILGMQAHIQLRSSFGAPISDPNPVLAVLRDKNIYASPVVSDGTVYVIDGAGVVFAVDAKTQAIIWRFSTKGGPGNCNNVAAPAVVGNYVHVGTTSGYYYVLDRRRGRPHRRRPAALERRRQRTARRADHDRLTHAT